MFKRRNHPLPSFPAGIRDKFYELCEVLNSEDLELLRSELSQFVAKSLQRKNVKYDKESVKCLYERATMLLDCYHGKTAKQQNLIVGAVRYFAVGEDLIPEEVFSTGLNDDIKIMNYVLEELGYGEYAIAMSS